MNLTNIMLFGGAVIGDGGSSESGLKTVTFDGNLTGKETFSGELILQRGLYVKVLDSVIANDELQELLFTLHSGGDAITNNLKEHLVLMEEEAAPNVIVPFWLEPNGIMVMLCFPSDVDMGEGIITAGTYVLYDENYMGFGAGYVSSLTYGNSGGGSSSGGVKALAWHTGVSGLEVYDNGGMTFSKLSNTLLTKNDIEGSVFGVTVESITVFQLLTGEIFNALVTEEDGILGIGEVLMSMDDTTAEMMEFPSGGVWVASGACQVVSLVWGI